MNGLAINKKYGEVLPCDDESEVLDNTALDFPATHLLRYEETTRMQKAVCHGVKITNK
jgi:hypothetical protein